MHVEFVQKRLQRYNIFFDFASYFHKKQKEFTLEYQGELLVRNQGTEPLLVRKYYLPKPKPKWRPQLAIFFSLLGTTSKLIPTLSMIFFK